MPCKARQNSVTGNEINIMSQCISFNALGPVPTAKIVFCGHLYVCLSAYQDTSWIAFFYVVFALHRGLKTAKQPPSNIADITSLFCADSNEQYGRCDTISILGVAEINAEDVYERKVEVANDIGVTTSGKDISLCHCLPSRNPRSRPIFVKFVRRETKIDVMEHEGNIENSSKKSLIMTM